MSGWRGGAGLGAAAGEGWLVGVCGRVGLGMGFGWGVDSAWVLCRLQGLERVRNLWHISEGGGEVSPLL